MTYEYQMTPVSTTSAEQIARALLAVLPLLNRVVAAELRADDTTVVQLRVLVLLADEPMTLSALARKRRISLQAASEHVQGLVERGWVVRMPDPNDRRQALLQPTDEGRTQLEQAREQIVQRFIPLVDRLSAEEADAVHAGLTALQGALAQEQPTDANLTDVMG